MKYKNSTFTRSSGILLHVSSLPSPYGIGSLGKAAYDWIDFLSDAGQSYWQLLPLVPAGYGNSPYKSSSAFAGYPSLIDLDVLKKERLLKPTDFSGYDWNRTMPYVDYELVDMNREDMLRLAYKRFKHDNALDDFTKTSPWVKDYALYMSIKKDQGQREWMDWDEPLRTRKPKALSLKREELKDDICYHTFVQYLFDRQWSALRAYANSKGVEIIGDIPIYVALESADVWANPGIFQLDKDSVPLEVSGCPPDNFSEDGQLWGNPLYDWDAMSRNRYKWWIDRLRHNFRLYDVIRIDHFRGLEGYYSIPYGAETAKDGKWKTGPGKDFIDAVSKSLPNARIIAEDLGFQTDGVKELLTYSGFPNMKLLQFAFDTRVGENEDDMPYSFVGNSVVYPGTHDNDTLKGWSKTAPGDSVKKAMEYTGTKRHANLPLNIIRLAMQCNSDLAVILMQDWLELGSKARMNTPGTLGGQNWRWRLEEDALSDRLAAQISEMTSMYGRSKE